MKAMKVLILLVFLNGNLLFSQELTGTIRGMVTDQSGGAMPKVLVTATGPVNMTVETDSSGGYAISVIPGEYLISFSKDKFESAEQKMSVRAGANTILNVTLEVAGVTQTITINVEEKMPEIDTGSSTIQTTIPSEIQTKLPSGTGYIGALTTVPGVRSEVIGGGIMSDGSSRAENDFYINGVKTSDAETGSLRLMSNAPFEFIQETLVTRSSDAQYGGSMGAVVNGILKRGGNEIHGQVWNYFSNDSMNASPRPYLRFSPLDDEEVEFFQPKKDKQTAATPGFHVGGQIIKNKLFFFSGSRPGFAKAERSVKFLKNDLTGNFSSSSRQDFTVNKLDYETLFRGRALQLYFAHMYSPLKLKGILPDQEGTSSPETLWHERGFRAPSSTILWKGTYFPMDKLTVSLYGGWNYTNFSNGYGLSKGPSVAYLTSNLNISGVPSRFRASSGQFTPDNFQTKKDAFKRRNIYLDGIYLLSFKGFHLMKFGYQSDHLQNNVFANTWPDGRFLMAWGIGWPGITKPGFLSGQYGFYIEDQMETSGKVRSESKAFYFQDDWQVKRNLVVNLGLRTESENIPSFLEGRAGKAISFGFSDKIAPRAGIAYDPTGSGKSKLSANFAVVYDIVKYNLPRSAFGGDKWLRCFYPLNDPDISKLKRGDTKKAFECLNLRVPANDLVDPSLKPMQQRMLTVGYERSFGNFLLSVYGINKSLIRAVEDVGRLVVKNGVVEEEYTITNPGEGRSIDPSWFPPGYPSPITPRARREYNALELRLDKKSGNHFVSANYTFGGLRGNYSGLASSDEKGRINPNTNRDFDMAYMSRDKDGKLVYGRLATDRPHVLKVFGYKTVSTRLGSSDLGLSFILQSGTPLSTQVPVLTSTNVFAYGRGDMGRLPTFSDTSLNFGHDFKLPEFKENQKMRIEWTVSNVFNQNMVMDRVTGLVHPNDGHLQFDSSAAVFHGFNPEFLMQEQGLRKNPAYGMPYVFQSPRAMRVAARFFF